MGRPLRPGEGARGRDGRRAAGLADEQGVDRLRHAERRPFYYAQEKVRRQVLAAWEKVRNPNEDLLRFGSLMEDLACYVDSSLVRTEDGAIVGRRGGIKAWLQVNIPALYLKYTTVMAYKTAARKLKQITGLADPVPAARLAEEPKVDEPVEVVRARAVYHEVMAEKPRSRTAWLGRIEAFIDPERVAEATTLAVWRRRYDDEITVRTKSGWVEKLKRLWRKTG